MKEQVIYGRWEYPIGNIPSEEIFKEYRYRSERQMGIAVGGLEVSIRAGSDRAAIILTFDRESDTFMKLYLLNKKDVKYKDIFKETLEYKEKQKKEEEMKKAMGIKE